jgi:putative ABC transport system permease protein
MSVFRQIARGWRGLIHRTEVDRDLNDEVQHFFDQATNAGLRDGLSHADARRAASIAMGNTTVAREHVRAYGWENVIETVMADVRLAIRLLRTNPAFSIIAVLTLAIGIGASTAIYSVVRPNLLAPVPYAGADRLVVVSDRARDGTPLPPTFGTFTELRTRARSFTQLAASDGWQVSLTGTTEPELLHGERISANFFTTLGVRPSVGRDFFSAEDSPDAPRVAILSDGLVQRRFAGDRSVVGKDILLDDVKYTVVGIMPRGFLDLFAPAADIWTPLRSPVHSDFDSREWGHHYRITGRLAQGASVRQTTAELSAIAAAPVSEFARPPWADMHSGIDVRPMSRAAVGSAAPTLFAIVGATVLLLLIACANVVNLLLARGAKRRTEFGMRIALGAERSRLVRQLLTENLVLATVAGVFALGIAWIGVRALVALSPPGLPRVDAIRVDARTFVFAFLATTIVGICVGIAPALRLSRGTLSDRIRGGSRGIAGGRAGLRGALVVGEFALALVLLVGAGLLMRSVQRLFAVDPGFDPSHRITMEVVVPASAMRSDTATRLFFDEALAAVRQVPGVERAAFTSLLPMSGNFEAYGAQVASAPGQKANELSSALRYSVTPDYFAAMGMTLRNGRLFQPSDITGGGEPVVVSESFARGEFGNADPIGQRVKFGPEVNPSRSWDVIVGVVADVKHVSLDDGDNPAFYVLPSQWPRADRTQTLVVRTSGDAASLAGSLKRAIWSVSREAPIQHVATLESLIGTTASSRRFVLIVIETFALAALVLAAIGLYGVISGGVAERTREIGIRSALGASPTSVVAQVLQRGGMLAAAGALIGVLAAVGASRLLETLLFGISRADPVTYGGVLAMLSAVTVAACWIPARRAARIDPAITLRSD